MQPHITQLRSLDRTQKCFIVVLVFVLYALGNHSLVYSVAPDFNIDGTLAFMKEKALVRLLGYVVLTAAALVGLILPPSQSVRVRRSLVLWVLLTLSWMALSFLWSGGEASTLKALIAGLGVWLGCAGLAQQLSVKAIRTAGVVYTASVISIGVVSEMALNTWKPLTYGYRFSGTIHPNKQGLTCALLIISLLHCTPHGWSNRLLRHCALVIGVLLLLLTQSRSALLAVIVASLVIAAATRVRAAKLAMLSTVFLLCVGMSGTLLYYQDHVGQRLINAATLQRDIIAGDSVGDTRIVIWTECLRLLKARPLLGFGYGGFWTEDRMHDLTAMLGFDVASAHSGYLETALSTGMVGCTTLLLTFFLALYCYMRQYRLTRSRDCGYGAAIIIVVLTNMLFESVTSTTCAAYILVVCVIMRQALFGGNRSAALGSALQRATGRHLLRSAFGTSASGSPVEANATTQTSSYLTRTDTLRLF